VGGQEQSGRRAAGLLGRARGRVDGSAGSSRQGLIRRWMDYRERQLDLLAESNRLRRETLEATQATAAAERALARSAQAAGTAQATPSGTTAADRAGTPGAGSPAEGVRTTGVQIASPFLIGFVGALGVLTAVFLAGNLARLSSVFTLVLVSVLITLALNPVVEVLTRRGVPRPLAVLVVFLGLVGVFALLIFLVVPPIVAETASLIEEAPEFFEELGTRPWWAELDARYDISERVTTEIEHRLSDTGFVSAIFGGVLGAAGWLATGVVGLLTTLILTLYFLAALPAVKEATYRLVPASRRPRVVSLAEEIMRRVGGYALGQVLVATINATCAWIMMSVLSIPYAVVLAVLVGILGLIPMVGATLGAAIVALVALFQDPRLALVVVVYFLVYQQIENYVIVPRVMSRTVSVPGAVTVVAVLAGGTLLGVLGALLAIPVAAGLLLLYAEVVVPRQDRR